MLNYSPSITRHRLTHGLFILFCLIFSVTSQAKPDPVPSVLEPWQDWVLKDEKSINCPFINMQSRTRRCDWPTSLSLNLSRRSGDFEYRLSLYKDTWVNLPGEPGVWPDEVKVDGKKALLIGKNNLPGIWLGPGAYKIQGNFKWSKQPDYLLLPRGIARLKLRLNGKTQNDFQLDAQSRLWLSANQQSQQQGDDLQIRVFRLLSDGIPMTLQTRLQLDVSGQERELLIGRVLLADMALMDLTSPLPAKLEDNGLLRVKVRPGQWELNITSRVQGQLDRFYMEPLHPGWPRQEIWSVNKDLQLRQLDVSGVKSIDPGQTPMPEIWQQYPAYQLNAGQQFNIKSLAQTAKDYRAPEKLTLRHHWWLSFDGQQLLSEDQLTGRLSKVGRLNRLPGSELGQASLYSQPQLISWYQKDGISYQGIEVRQRDIEVNAISTQSASVLSKGFSAVGWDNEIEQLSAELNLPPGWKLLWAKGVDKVTTSWLGYWTLWHVFIVLLVSLAFARLYGGGFSLLMFIWLVLAYQESWVPLLAWIGVLCILALLTVLPEGRWRHLMLKFRQLSIGILLISAMIFIVTQARLIVYPQLEVRGHQAFSSAMQQPAYTPGGVVMEKAKSVRKSLVLQDSMAELSLSPAIRAKTAKPAHEYQIAALQTGPGVPQWRWNRIQLKWQGLVQSEQQLQLHLLSPIMTALLRAVQISLLILLLMLLMGKIYHWSFLSLKKAKPLAPYLMLLVFVMPMDVFAEIPDQALQDQLKSHLMQQPDCLPQCAAINKAYIQLDRQQLSIRLQVNTELSVAVPLPVNKKMWSDQDVLVNNRKAKALWQDEHAQLWLALPRGRFDILIRGSVTGINQLKLPVVWPWYQVSSKINGWELSGLHKDTAKPGVLQLLRLQRQTQKSDQLWQAQANPFVKVVRQIQIDKQWRVFTKVQRLAPLQGSFNLSIPLLENESPLDETLQITNGKVDLGFSQGINEVSWYSMLEQGVPVTLEAPMQDSWSEQWQLQISPRWRWQAQGLEHKNKLWRPWPGDQVVLSFSQPEAVEGKTLTIDKMRLNHQPGNRISQSSVMLDVRSSQADKISLILPAQAELQSLSNNGIQQPLYQREGRIDVAVTPGMSHIKMAWRQAKGAGIVYKLPQVTASHKVNNYTLNSEIPAQRWVLALSGPAMGSVVLYWGVLFAMLLAALVLGRLDILPMTTWQWILLAVGLSTASLSGFVLVLLWFGVFYQRSQWREGKRWLFNLGQIFLPLLTLLMLAVIFVHIPQGLLGQPDMQIHNLLGPDSLAWYQDSFNTLSPSARIISLPLWSYQLIMLFWSLWFAYILISWLKWAWSCYSAGQIWMGKIKT